MPFFPKHGDEMTLDARSAHWIIDRDVFATIWKVLLDPQLDLKKYGRSQPCKHRMTNDIDAAYAELQMYRRLVNKAEHKKCS